MIGVDVPLPNQSDAGEVGGEEVDSLAVEIG